jgi:hypothetical protein
LAELVTEVTEGRYADAGTLTVAELLERFLELNSHKVDPTTLHGYRRVVDYSVAPRIGWARVAKLRAPDLDRFYANLLASAGKGGKAPCVDPRHALACVVVDHVDPG